MIDERGDLGESGDVPKEFASEEMVLTCSSETARRRMAARDVLEVLIGRGEEGSGLVPLLMMGAARELLLMV
jgi:hypothetical protein